EAARAPPPPNSASIDPGQSPELGTSGMSTSFFSLSIAKHALVEAPLVPHARFVSRGRRAALTTLRAASRGIPVIPRSGASIGRASAALRAVIGRASAALRAVIGRASAALRAVIGRASAALRAVILR